MCEHESELWEAVAAGRWPDAVDQTVVDHVRACATCTDVVEVSSMLLADACAARHESTPPSSAIVWWRAQMRARHEAALSAERPLTVVHALAIACAAGLLVGLLGLAGAWARTHIGSLDPPLPASLLASTTAHLPLTGVLSIIPWIALVSLLLAPLAVYVIVSDD
jgi:hypothetical protein